MADDVPEGDKPEPFSEPPPFFSETFGAEPASGHELVRVEIEAVFVREDSASLDHFVVLKDRARRLSIRIDPCNALAISQPLDGTVPKRPLTHDLIKTIFERLNVTVVRVTIDDLWSDTYYARLVLKFADEEMEIDSRPSDAIAIATRYDSPIFVSESIMKTADEI